MNDITENTDLDVDSAEAQMAEARDAFDRAVRILAKSCNQLEAVPDTGDGDVLKSLRQMNGAYLLTIDLREKARVAGSKRFGDAGTGKLDLTAARDEIGLRLACLRKSGGGSGIPGGSE